MDIQKVKLILAYIAYIAYLLSTIIQNELNIALGRYQYIFCFIILVSIKLSQHVEQINKFVIDNTELEIIKERVNSIFEMQSQSQPQSQRSEVNEPITPQNIIYLDNLLKQRKVHLNGYDIELMQTPK